MMDGQTIKRCSTVHTALAELAADPALLPACRNAVCGCILTMRSVEERQRGAHLQLVPGGRPRSDVRARRQREHRPDVRARQLPVGDRDGGHDDAA